MSGQEGEGARGSDGEQTNPRPPSPVRPLLLIAAVWLISTLLWLTPGVTKPDGAGYLVYLPSTYFDHDVAFFNEWAQLGMIRGSRVLHKEVTSTGHLGNHWTVGSAMYWFPSFVFGDALRAVIPGLRSFPRNGLSLPYNVPVIFASATAGLLTLLVGYSMARKYAPVWIAVLAALGIWFGTPLLYYSLRSSTMAHAVSALSCGLAFAAALRLREQHNVHDWLLAGLAGGFCFVVRPQNAPFALLALFFARPRPKDLAVWVGAGVLASLPQFLVSWRIYGDLTGFLVGPFAAFERIWIWESLFSWYHGLIPWAPITAIGLAGIFILFRRDSRLAAACTFVFCTQWLINSVVERTFWGAHAFGPRRFDNCAVVFLIGIAVALAAMPRWLAAVVTAMTSLWTMSLFLAAPALDLGRYYTPGELWRAQSAGLSDAASRLGLLEAVPERARTVVLLIILSCLMLWTAAIFLMRRMRSRTLAYAAGIYAVFCVVWFAMNRRDDVLPRYAELAALNRPKPGLPIGAEGRTALLRDELDYLRRSGRTELAARTERELEALILAMQAQP